MPSRHRRAQEAILLDEFSGTGGHVDWTDDALDAITAHHQGAALVPAVVRWVREHRAVEISAADVRVGWRAIRGRRGADPSAPVAYFGYAGWHPLPDPADRLDRSTRDRGRFSMS